MAKLPPTRVLAIIIVTVLLVALAAIVLAWVNAWSAMDSDNPDGFWVELGKAGMQALIVVGLGAPITIMLKQHEIQQEQEEKRRQEEQEQEEKRRQEELEVSRTFRADLLMRLRAAYREIKDVRSQLEAAGFWRDAAVPLSPESAKTYSEQMGKLVQAQLAIEEMELGVVSVGGVGMTVGAFQEHLSGMERYLAQVLREYRNLAPDVARNSPTLSYEQFPETQQFVTVSFGPKLALPYYAAVQELAADPHTPRRNVSA